MKHETWMTRATAAVLVLASACSGIDGAGQDETILDVEDPSVEPDLGQITKDDPAVDLEEHDADPDEPVLGTLEQALGAPRVRAYDSQPFGGNIFAEDHRYTIGGDCSAGYVRSGTPQTQWTSQAGGHCVFEGWLNPTNTRDCRARILAHTGGGWFGGTCQSWVFEEREPITFYYSAANTNSAQINTTNRSVALDAGQTVRIGTCGLVGASSNGDTFLRVVDPAGTLVALNDDACSGLGSRLDFTAPSTGTFEVRAGCYDNRSCSGAVVIQ